MCKTSLSLYKKKLLSVDRIFHCILLYSELLALYCERSPNETSLCFQTVHYNHNFSSNRQSIYANSQYVEWNEEWSRKSREGDREQRINGVREGPLVENGVGVG